MPTQSSRPQGSNLADEIMLAQFHDDTEASTELAAKIADLVKAELYPHWNAFVIVNALMKVLEATIKTEGDDPKLRALLAALLVL